MGAEMELIKLYAKQIKIPTVADYAAVIREAEEKGLGYEKFLHRLLEREIQQRQENQRKRRVRDARYPLHKSLDEFNFKRLENIDEAQIWQFATGEFIRRKENIIMIGNPGTGKSHLSIGLGMRLCKEGFNVRFHTAAGLVTELSEAQDNSRLSKIRRQLEKVDLLVVDELSYLTFSREQTELLFHILAIRYEKGSVIITTNLEFSRWTEMFPDAMLTAALIDRLTHRSHILDMNGDSYRLKESLGLNSD